MSAGDFFDTVYETDDGTLYPISVQPETLTFTLNAVANTAPTGDVTLTVPTANVSGSRRRNGAHTRLVRFRFTGTLPPGYSGGKSVITLPVLQKSVWDGFKKSQTGTYTLNGTAYDVAFVGKTGEKIR